MEGLRIASRGFKVEGVRIAFPIPMLPANAPRIVSKFGCLKTYANARTLACVRSVGKVGFRAYVRITRCLPYENSLLVIGCEGQ